MWSHLKKNIFLYQVIIVNEMFLIHEDQKCGFLSIDIIGLTWTFLKLSERLVLLSWINLVAIWSDYQYNVLLSLI